MSLDEKTDVIKGDEVEDSPSTIPISAGSLDGELLGCDKRPSAERKLVRMLDMRLLPTIILISIMNYIDVRLSCSLISHALSTYIANVTLFPLMKPVHVPSQRLALTAARLKGLEQDLGLSGDEYSASATILHVSWQIAALHRYSIRDRTRHSLCLLHPCEHPLQHGEPHP